MSRLSMMPWFPESFVAATRGWSLLERALYRELLDAQWINGSLPSDEKELMRMAGATRAEWSKAWPTVSRKFDLRDGQYLNRRLEEHRSKANELHEKRRAAANKTNAQRYGERSLSEDECARSATRSAGRSATRSALGDRVGQRSHDSDTDTDHLRLRGLPEGRA